MPHTMWAHIFHLISYKIPLLWGVKRPPPSRTTTHIHTHEFSYWNKKAQTPIDTPNCRMHNTSALIEHSDVVRWKRASLSVSTNFPEIFVGVDEFSWNIHRRRHWNVVGAYRNGRLCFGLYRSGDVRVIFRLSESWIAPRYWIVSSVAARCHWLKFGRLFQRKDKGKVDLGSLTHGNGCHVHPEIGSWSLS